MAVVVLNSRIDQALAFASASTDRVACGSPAILDNVAKGTSITLTYPIATTVQSRFYGKSNGSTINNTLRHTTTGELIRVVNRNTTNMVVTAAASAVPTYRQDKWCLVGARWDTAGSVQDLGIFHGDLLTDMQEASAYTTRVVGSGTLVDDAALNFFLGNMSATATQAYGGRIVCIYIIRDYLMDDEEIKIAGRLIARQEPLLGRIAPPTGLWYPGRNGTGIVLDESGNGNHGTITGATVGEGPPLRRFIPFRRSSYVLPSGAAPIAFDAASVARDRYVVAAAVTLGAVPASAPAITRDRVVAAGALARTEKIATLVEAFDGGSLPGTLSDGSTGDGSVSVAGGQLVLDVGTGTGYPYVSAVDSYSLNGSSVFWQLVTTDNALHYPGVYSFAGGTHGYYFAVDGNAGMLRAFRWADGVDTELASVAYDSAAHYQMRIRESGGTLYLETAPAGGTWSTLASEATNTNPAFIPTTVRLVFEAWYDGDAGALAEYESINVATGTALDAAPVPRDRGVVAAVATVGAVAASAAPVTRDRQVVPAALTIAGAVGYDAPSDTRDRWVVAASLTLGTVAAVAPALSRDRFVLATDGAVAGTLALEAAPVVRDRVAVAGALAFDTGLDFDGATETRDRWSVAADGDAELVGAGGGILSRERWVLAAVAVVGALALDAAPVARDRHVAAGTVSTLAPHLLEAAPVSRDRFVLPAGGAAGTSLGGGAIATRDRVVVAATVSTGSAAADLVPVTRDRVVVPALATSGLTTSSSGVARDRYTVAADVVAVGGLAGASRPVARDRWVVAAVASSGVLAFEAVPVTRDRFVLPVAAGEPQQAAGAPVTRDRHVVAASLSFVRRFPGTRGVVLLGVPQGLVVLGVPQGLVILDEEGNVGSYAMKRGDDDPPLDFQCTGTDGLPVAFVGDEALEVGVRRSGESGFALLKEATFLDAALGKIRVVWDIGDSEFLAVGDMEFELQVLRTGARATTFPAEGYGVFPIWQDIVPDADS